MSNCQTMFPRSACFLGGAQGLWAERLLEAQAMSPVLCMFAPVVFAAFHATMCYLARECSNLHIQYWQTSANGTLSGGNGHGHIQTARNFDLEPVCLDRAKKLNRGWIKQKAGVGDGKTRSHLSGACGLLSGQPANHEVELPLPRMQNDRMHDIQN